MRLLKVLGALLLVLVLVMAGTAYWGYRQIAGSLPELDGELPAKGLVAQATIERDELGVPTIQAKSRRDLAYALGYTHAQDRFFQMDLLRRNSAGELSELVGKAALDHDRQTRVHRFRARGKRVLDAGNDQQRELVLAYTDGVNAGLEALGQPPFEYVMLGAAPAPWRPEDSSLVLYSMYLDLQWDDFDHECKIGVMREAYPPAMFDFLLAAGSEWDAPIDGDDFTLPPTPGPEVINLRNPPGAQPAAAPVGEAAPSIDHLQDTCSLMRGSNCWAVAGKHTKHGGALLADDMHLGIRVPNIWYRAQFQWTDEAGDHAITGVTLPGTPAMVVGSNGQIAWGFTNSEGDWLDVVLLDTPADNPDAYQTPDGPQPFEKHAEQILVKDAPAETLEVRETIWGPVINRSPAGQDRVARWVAHDTEGVNLGLIALESCTELERALELANLAGSPAQNFVVADKQGRIAWTILGRIPRRPDFDGRLPASWTDGQRAWQGYLEPGEYPRVVDPPTGRIWTANARVANPEMLKIVRDGGYDLGARQSQIRDDLLALEQASEADMLAIQLDDRAVLLERWQKLLLDTLDEAATKDQPQRTEARALVEQWGARAAIDSVGFRIVRNFRLKTVDLVGHMLAAPCRQQDPSFRMPSANRLEPPVWRLVTERPEHLLDAKYADWQALLLESLDAVLAELTADGQPLAQNTWGEANTAQIRHPIAEAVPQLADWLNMPAEPLAGDTVNMPRIQRPSSGASERLCVSPGREAEGYFHMPCGQSGHPLSPHYRDGHAAWTEGRQTPFLPGKAVHRLVLSPAGG
ncbi:MAG: penicillin acylase family protein [Pirellulales bacterium]|nr:penicillin acylase family protein [Pirellulales bacterium]